MISKVNKTSVRLMTSQDLGLVLTWRNHPNIRRYMYTQHEISPSEHSVWFKKTSEDPKCHLLMFEIENNPLGFINIQEIESGGIAEWGFYAAPSAPKGTGTKLGKATLAYAFSQIGLHKLCGKTLASNEPSIGLHNRLGFTQEGVLQDQYFDGQKYHNVVQFGLLASEYHKLYGVENE